MAKSNLTKAKEISQQTKKAVLGRQHCRSISGVALHGGNTEFHHVIYRSGSGIGAEWNVVAITSEEHRRYHDGCSIKVNGRDRYTNEEFGILMKNHLKMNYIGWSEEKCRYQKYKEFDEYGVIRCCGKK